MALDIQKWLEQLEQGSADGQEFWETYFPRLVRLARRQLKQLPRRVADEEDVALSAMNSFVQGARAGRFGLLADETNLWRLLVTITARKATAQRRRHFASRRNHGQVRGDSVFGTGGDPENGGGIDAVAGSTPTPEFAAEIGEELQRLLSQLDDPSLQEIACWKMEGWSNEEIAAKLGRSERTIERKLSQIRACWNADEASHD